MARHPRPTEQSRPAAAGPDGSAAGRRPSPTVVVGAGTAVVVLAVLGAAWGGSWELQPRHYDLGWSWQRTGDPPPEADLEPVPPPDGTGSGVDVGWLGPAMAAVLRLVVLVAVVLVSAAALRWLWHRFRYRDTPRPRPAPAGGGGAVVEEPALPVLRRGVAEAQRSLADIDRPVDAVVAAWLALEEAAGSSGVRRSPAQTPTEFTVAVLRRTSADPGATTELLALYHRARFSQLPIGGDEVEAASRCLGRLAASWSVVEHRGAPAR